MNVERREIYLNKIKPFINKPLIKVLTGQRRIGKSYLLCAIVNNESTPKSRLVVIFKKLNTDNQILKKPLSG